MYFVKLVSFATLSDSCLLLGLILVCYFAFALFCLPFVFVFSFLIKLAFCLFPYLCLPSLLRLGPPFPSIDIPFTPTWQFNVNTYTWVSISSHLKQCWQYLVFITTNIHTMTQIMICFILFLCSLVSDVLEWSYCVRAIDMFQNVIYQ